MGFFRRLIFYYLLRRSQRNRILTPPRPKNVWRYYTRVGRRSIKVKFGFGYLFMYYLEAGRFYVETRIDEKFGFRNKRIEWLMLFEKVQDIERELKNAGNK